MSVGFLFPGQGSQYPGMLKALPKHPEITKILSISNQILGEDITSWDNKQKLQSTSVVQILTLISSMGAYNVLKSKGVLPDIVAGHSVGAFGAAVASGVLDFESALRLVKLRGEFMQNKYPKNYGMAIVQGVFPRKLNQIVNECTTLLNPVYIANYNTPNQIIVSGHNTGLDKVITTVKKVGIGKAKYLNVNVPSHCELLTGLSKELRKEFKFISIHEPKIPYIGGKDARVLRYSESIVDDLVLGVSQPVRWHEASSLMYELETQLFIEMPPGDVLSRMSAKEFPAARSLSFDNHRIDSIAALIQHFRIKD